MSYFHDETIDGLIAALQEAREDLGGDAPVRLAFQPSYPMYGTLSNVVDAQKEGEEAPALYLATGGGEYAPRDVFG